MTPERYQRIGQLFDEAFARAPAERAAWLEQACGADAELRDDVVKLLDNHDESKDFLSLPALGVAAAMIARNQRASVVGKQLGHYQILSLLGAGGQGRVYLARDTRLGRQVAIKLLPPHLMQDAEHIRRFEQESHATSALDHPNILMVYDLGVHEGIPYLAMELLEGEDLRAQLPLASEASPIPIGKVIDYARQIASGLTAAHEIGIIHRDLKPENLFVTKEGRVKILGFGLAKLRLPRDDSAGVEVATYKQITNPGTLMGTVAYMSPEQVRGQELEPRSDLFSFGLILFEMLHGKRAFMGESHGEVMDAILEEDLPELSGSNNLISPALDEIVRRCLEKLPERRFHSARDLGFALEAL
jgi:serine/threonine protein kinase